MKEYLIVYIEYNNNVFKYGNIIINASSKREAINTFKVDNKNIICNIIDLD